MIHVKKFAVVLMISVFAFGATSCATTKKESASAVEVDQSGIDVDKMRMEEREAMQQSEMERMRQEELASSILDGDAQSAREINFDPSTILETINFDYDKFDLRASGRDTLSRNAEWINANPGYQVQIEGHCDERGSDEYNLALGERRATAAKNYLISLGVDEARVFTISYGEELPADSRHDEDGWAKNRRAEFKVATP